MRDESQDSVYIGMSLCFSCGSVILLNCSLDSTNRCYDLWRLVADTTGNIMHTLKIYVVWGPGEEHEISRAGPRSLGPTLAELGGAAGELCVRVQVLAAESESVSSLTSSE